MRLPQVSERIKEAPAQALRGVFAGIGQVLLITDKLRNKPPADQQVPPARVPEPSETRADPAPPPPPPSPPPVPSPVPSTAPAAAAAAPSASPASTAQRVPEPRDLDKTGNVRLLTSQKARAGDTAPTVEAASADAPLPNYDQLSIASLRARLRNLDVTQLTQLAEYEKAHADRADVVSMFERRIAKLEAEKSSEVEPSSPAEERGEAEAEAEIEAREEVADEAQEDVAAEAEEET
jgi:hypothetical protein